MFVAEFQSLLAEWQYGRKGTARHAMSWQNPFHTRRNFFCTFGLLELRHISMHIKFLRKCFVKSMESELAERSVNDQLYQ